MADYSRAALHSTPGVAAERDPATKGFKFQQTMIRIKEPKRSLDFYTRVLGMTLLSKLDFPTMKFTLYFVAYTDSASDVPEDPRDRIEATFGRCALNTLPDDLYAASHKLTSYICVQRGVSRAHPQLGY